MPKILPRGRGAGPVPVMLTRLHVRYTRETFPEDLVFQETEDQESFQGRYIIRHPWTGPITCQNPNRGVWGGPPPGVQGDTRPAIATDLAFVARDAKLEGFLAQDVPELALTETTSRPPPLPAGPLTPPPPEPKPSAQGCGRCAVGSAQPADALAPLGLAAALGLWLRRRRRR